MFVWSVKRNQIKLICIVLFVLISIIAISILAKDGEASLASSSKQSLSAKSTEERLSFLSGFGWTADEQSEEVSEVIIPEEFDEVYSSYNDLQKQQGFDLSVFAGKRVKRWTYVITNYPGYEDKVCIRANILVYNEKVIGGDICSVELDGFMQTFNSRENESTKT